MTRPEAKTIHGAAVLLAQVEADFQMAGGKGRSTHFDRNRDALVEAAIRYAKVFINKAIHESGCATGLGGWTGKKGPCDCQVSR